MGYHDTTYFPSLASIIKRHNLVYQEEPLNLSTEYYPKERAYFMFSYLRRYSHIAFIAITCLMHSSSAASAAPKQKKKQDLNDNRGNTPFYLQDPYDEMCLGPHGFTACNEQALWVLTRRPVIVTYRRHTGTCLFFMHILFTREKRLIPSLAF